ncbi:GNAT family N-acetyltransferase [Paenibacillus tengchongensis]|uniref:GNAT family N-acetyltransferase n=1 Tax=Paenibacillus tengchongensis TaxID=2608684 RepID=UPI0016522F37|nr:GNAT family N-acetyltransferase [Paenibacillus tengchongensis]
MLKVEIAGAQDAAVLTEIQKRAFDADAQRYQRPDNSGPPGYDSIGWQAEMIDKGYYYKLLDHSRIIGGMLVYAAGKEEYNLVRIYIDPGFQNRGYGREAIRRLFSLYPDASKWSLDTPSWAVRNQHLYTQLGFVQTKINRIPDSEDMFYEYERLCEGV